MNESYINSLAKEIHKNNVEKGWWDGEQCLFNKLQLVSTEVAEATEGARKNLMDDHLPQYKMECVELADALIRTLDIGGKLELTYSDTPLQYHLIGKDLSVGSNHLGINILLVDFVKAFYIGKDKNVLNDFYSAVVGGIISCAKVRGFNLAQPMKDKLDYNSVRKDHLRENRAKQGGKKF